jgi:hypothetical protein
VRIDRIRLEKRRRAFFMYYGFAGRCGGTRNYSSFKNSISPMASAPSEIGKRSVPE